MATHNRGRPKYYTIYGKNPNGLFNGGVFLDMGIKCWLMPITDGITMVQAYTKEDAIKIVRYLADNGYLLYRCISTGLYSVRYEEIPRDVVEASLYGKGRNKSGTEQV